MQDSSPPGIPQHHQNAIALSHTEADGQKEAARLCK